MQFFSEGGEIKRQRYLPFITKRRNKKTKKNLWDRFRRDMNKWFYWEWPMNIFQAENKNQMRSWGDWLIDSSLTIRKKGTWHTHKTSQKKLLKNKNICTIYIYIYIFRQLSLSLLQFPISEMPLPKIKQFFFSFSSYFGNAIATNPFHKFFFPFILAMPLPQINCHFFFFFWEMICAHHFYNIFTTNPKWQVVTSCYCWIKKVISVLNSNFN